MPWNRPSSQPTSWAWAIRSSDSVGGASSNGWISRSSSSSSSGASPSLSSLIEVCSTVASRLRPGSSRGAAFTSSSSCCTMRPIRMTLAGCSTSPVSRSALSPLSLSSSRSASAGTATCWPSGPITMTWSAGGCWSCVDMVSTLPTRREQDLAAVGTRLHELMGAGCLRQRHLVVYDGPHLALRHEGPHVLDHRGADRTLLLGRTGPQRGRDDRPPLAQEGTEVELALAAPLHADDHQPALGREGGDVALEVLRTHVVEDHV